MANRAPGSGLQRRSPALVPPPADTDPAATIRRLRAELQRAKEDIEQLRAQLGHANLTIAELRKKIPGKLNQAAAPSK
jgi:cytochrome c-type biogenesis protein CcmH/NrfG